LNQFRGFLDFDLDDKGYQEAQESADLVKDVAFGAFYTSDLKRAVQTFEVVRLTNLYSDGVPIEVTSSFRPWNVGIFAGEDKTPESKAALQSFADNPDVPIPGGSSLNEFRARVKDLFDRAVAKARLLKKPIGMFGHASNGHEIGNIIYGDIDAVDTDPGGVVMIYEDNGKLQAKVIKNPPNTDDAGYGKS
jgi:broad specificity phosphatase PhoE